MHDLDAAALVEALRNRLPRLAEKDQTFARDLMASVGRRGFATEKQALWLRRLAERADKAAAPKPAPVRIADDLGGVIALFETASTSLKHPAVVLRCEGLGDVRLSIAGESAKVPGSITVAERERGGAWFGRVLRDGRFEANPRQEPPPALLALLRDFAARPAEVASVQGKRTGRCCFCARELDDERSVKVGYGPVCARRYGLGWGAEPKRRKRKAE